MVSWRGSPLLLTQVYKGYYYKGLRTLCETVGKHSLFANNCILLLLVLRSDPTFFKIRLVEIKESSHWHRSVSHTSSSAWWVSGSRLTVTHLSVSGPYVLCSLDGEAQCRTALTDWLLRHGEQTYYDRLSRALQHIGRTDIAIGEQQMETERTCVPMNNIFK